ncbi:MAG: hypothetical protein EXR98_21100 [Gemmataceae bacterium]|nr:hypothetical protein [Gemmataceae bacterium]
MKFTVVALESVDATLATLYYEAADPQTITDAANWMERELKTDPLTKVSPIDNLYYLRRDSLVALCEISVPDRIVKIVEIHRIDE